METSPVNHILINLLGLAVWIVFIWLLFKFAHVIVSPFRKSGPFFCTSCGYRGKKRGYRAGQIILLLCLLLMFVIPGIIYAVYLDRLAKRCPQCDSATMIPSDSAVAKEQIQKLEHPEANSDTRVPCPMCAELILPAAKRCRFCGHVLASPTG